MEEEGKLGKRVTPSQCICIQDDFRENAGRPALEEGILDNRNNQKTKGISVQNQNAHSVGWITFPNSFFCPMWKLACTVQSMALSCLPSEQKVLCSVLGGIQMWIQLDSRSWSLGKEKWGAKQAERKNDAPAFHSFFHSTNNSTEGLLCARHYWSYWGYKGEQSLYIWVVRDEQYTNKYCT